jgi:transcriptional regulator with XRE-family HTH domain
MVTCGEFLAHWRKIRGLSQKEVADLLGYKTGQFVSNWERNKSQPPIPVLKDLAKILEIPEETLFNVVLEQHLKDVTTQLHQQIFGAEEKTDTPKLPDFFSTIPASLTK